MKDFVFGIFVWFLIQLIFISAFGNMGKLEVLQGGRQDLSFEECSKTNPVFGFLAGAIVPLAATNLVNGDWCWNQ